MVIMVKMTTTIKKFAKVYLLLDVAVILACIIANNYEWLLNTQVAFISAMLINLGSFYGYQKNIQNRLQGLEETKASLQDDPDVIDKIDDPFDLYSEINEEKEDYTAQEIKEIITQEKKKIKQHTFKNALFSASGFASVYRILGYVVLVFGFFALNNNGFLNVFAYVVGLLTVTLATLFINISSKSVEDQS